MSLGLVRLKDKTDGAKPVAPCLSLELQFHTRQHAKVARRIVGPSGDQIGAYNHQPMLNTTMYEVEFEMGR